jgi:nucleotide-binding universal stress UspA family protein
MVTEVHGKSCDLTARLDERSERWTMKKKPAGPQVPLKNILFATDLTRYSHEALPYVRSLARKYGSKIFAFHVVSPTAVQTTATGREKKISVTSAVRQARSAMKDLEPEWGKLRHQTIVRSGDVWREISKVIREKKIDLVVTGTHGRRGATKALLGSVAEKIFRQAPCPVLTVGPNTSGEPESIADLHSILFPTDFSPASLAALPYAISFAQENRASLYLLHVMASVEEGPVAASFMDRLRNLAPRGEDLWCEPKAFVESGHPGEVILQQAEEMEVDLIVLGTKTRRTAPRGRPLPMATAYKVVSRAICPVLTIHAGARRTTALPRRGRAVRKGKAASR